jgi:hypothetical protein
MKKCEGTKRAVHLNTVLSYAGALGELEDKRAIPLLKSLPGQLIVKYMQVHQNRWPSSWDDLVTVKTEAGSQMMLYGASAGDTDYLVSLRKKVAIDWKFDPSRGGQSSSVTRPDGTRFPIIWEGAGPNDCFGLRVLAGVGTRFGFIDRGG